LSSGKETGSFVGKEDIKNIAPVVSKTNFLTPETEVLRRGTGGRSSFNGIVATVFGAPGFLGSKIVTRLGRVGAQVICPYRGEPRFVTRLKLCGDLGQILFVPFYLRDDASIHKAMKYSNVVVNCIGKINETPSFDFNDVHVDGARRIARIARESGVKRLIHVSALDARPDPEPQVIRGGSQWLKSKYYGELAVREEYPEAIIFRPADMFGYNDNFLHYYAHWYRRSRRKILVWKKGKGTFKTPVFVGDVAEAIVNAMTDPRATGQTIDAIGPKRYELKDIVNMVNQIIQKDEYHFYDGIGDLRFYPGFWFRVYATEQIKKYPRICRERIEKEMITDVPTPGNLRLEDLGLSELTDMEDKAYPMLERFKRFGYYDEELGEKPKPDPLKHYPLELA
jgi:NADH dehydrogenase (ubiquinone) 1 alpha subcomplex subunit 9